VTTARSFKGLEADVVVLYGVEDFGSGFSRADLYVAWTRPRHRLFIVAAEGEVRAAAEAAIKEGCSVVHADHR
jgi:ATP-dependent exoDNAse (exonuclease V) alpha subunit